MDNKVALSSMAMDLKRAALGWHRNSNMVAERFFLEAIKRRNEVDDSQVSQHIKDIFKKVENFVHISDTSEKAENALMFSTLIQNFVLDSSLKSHQNISK